MLAFCISVEMTLTSIIEDLGSNAVQPKSLGELLAELEECLVTIQLLDYFATENCYSKTINQIRDSDGKEKRLGKRATKKQFFREQITRR